MSTIDDVVDAVTRDLGLALAADAPGGAIGVVVDGEVAHVSHHGLANVEFGVPWRASTRYRLASITKTFTAQAVLAAADRGLLALDQPAHELLQVLGPHHRDVTVEHLLTMSSGIPYDEDLCDLVGVRGRIGADFLVDLAVRQPLQFSPGTDQVYACASYRLLAMLLARVTGGPWTDALRTFVLEPLGLHVSFGGHYDDLEHDEATAYRPRPAGEPAGSPRRRHANHFECTGDGALKGTLDDLVRWCVASGARSGPVPTWARLVDVAGAGGPGWYRAGVCIGSLDGAETWYHGGASNTFYLHLPARAVTVACLVNEMGVPARELAAAVARGVVAARGATPSRPPTTARRPPAGELVDPGSGLLVDLDPDRRTATVLSTPATLEPCEGEGWLVVTRSRRLVLEEAAGHEGALVAHLGAERVRLVPAVASGPPGDEEGLVGAYDAATLPGTVRIVLRGGRLALVQGAGGEGGLEHDVRWVAPDVGVAGAIGVVVERSASGAVVALRLSTLPSRHIRFARRPAPGQ